MALNFYTSQQMTDRKTDHIQLALGNANKALRVDARFDYEPLLASNDTSSVDLSCTFLGKNFTYPLWLSSMTGGSELSRKINEKMARACMAFGLGMGLGSCRSLLTSMDHFADFNMRQFMGDRPLYANLGIAQLEKTSIQVLEEVVGTLSADGLIIHINPLQEFLQAEGDRYSCEPLETIQRICEEASFPLIVKEVGQGMGPNSLKALLKLPIAAIELAAFGGTNFSLIENQRQNEEMNPLVHVGHEASEMVQILNSLAQTNDCKEIIISGGVKNFLDAYFLRNISKMKCLYGQAGMILKYATLGYEELRKYIQAQIDGYKMATLMLKVKK